MSGQQTGGDSVETAAERAACRSAEHPLTEQAVAADVQVLAALGNETRYEALRLVAGAEDGLCVCEIEPALGVSQGAVSQALSRLFGAGLVDRRKEGRWRYYTATPRAERLLAVLDEMRAADETEKRDDAG
jgi:ArsR family transcriptional regulator